MHFRVINFNFSRQILNIPGNIPNEIVNTKNLKQFYGAYNNFYGLPKSMAGLFKLKIVHLEVNAIEGKIPADFSQSYMMEEVNFPPKFSVSTTM